VASTIKWLSKIIILSRFSIVNCLCLKIFFCIKKGPEPQIIDIKAGPLKSRVRALYFVTGFEVQTHSQSKAHQGTQEGSLLPLMVVVSRIPRSEDTRVYINGLHRLPRLPLFCIACLPMADCIFCYASVCRNHGIDSTARRLGLVTFELYIELKGNLAK
jgi:hypothetical protein